MLSSHYNIRKRLIEERKKWHVDHALIINFLAEQGLIDDEEDDTIRQRSKRSGNIDDIDDIIDFINLLNVLKEMTPVERRGFTQEIMNDTLL